MARYRWGKLGANCNLETAKVAYDIVCKEYYRLQDENDRLKQLLEAKEAEIRQLKEKDRENGHQLWEFFRYLARFDSVSFSDETDKSSFEYVFRHTK